MGTLLVTTSGIGSWVVPAGVTSVDAECWGAGAGGGFNPAGSIPGGGGGAYSKTPGLAVTAGNVWNYSVGAGGTAYGGAGGHTYFQDPSAVIQCEALGGSAPVNSSTGGVGGAAAGGTGTTKHSGGNGFSPGVGGGGGGSSAGTAADGANAVGGNGGVAPAGGGNGGNGGVTADGSPGSIPGGAGGGADVGWNAAPGANGKLLLTWADPSFSADMVRSDETIDVAAEVVCRALQKQVIAY